MGAYILKRILLMIPTLLGIMLMTFAVIQFVPGGPVEQVIAKMQGTDTDSAGRISGNTGNEAGGNQQQMQAGPDAANGEDPGARGVGGRASAAGPRAPGPVAGCPPAACPARWSSCR